MRKFILLTTMVIAAFASCKKDDLKPEALAVSFSVTPAEPVTESEAVFTVEVKGGEFPFTYEWNFGDNLTGSKYQETVIYKTSGEKKVSLKVTDNNGSVGFAEKTINVRDKSAVPQIEAPLVKEREVTHSSITVQWAITEEPENDGTYEFELLEGQTLVNKYTKTGKFENDGIMSFGGLKPATAYKFRVKRVATGYDSDGDGEINPPVKIDSEWSEIDITTASAPVDDPEAILVERFDNFIWGPNYLLGGYCFRAKDEKGATSLDVETIFANSSTGSYFATFTEAFRTATNTLSGWNGAQVYGFVGVAKFGSSSAYGMIETPALGRSGNLEVKFDLIPFEEDRPTIYVSVTGGGSVDRSSINLEGRESGKWVTETVNIIGATENTKLKIASSESLASNQRFALDNIIVKPASSTAPMIGVDKSELVFAAAGESFTLKVNSTVPWSAESTGDWVTIDPATGQAGETSVTVTASPGNVDREAILTFTTTSGTPAATAEVELRQVVKTPLATPVKIADEITYNTMMVRWDDVEGANYNYHFELAEAGSPDVPLNALTEMSFANSKNQYKPAIALGNLKPSTAYIFKVKALAQEEAYSDSEYMTFEFTTKSAPETAGYILCERFDGFIWGPDYQNTAFGLFPGNSPDSIDDPADQKAAPGAGNPSDIFNRLDENLINNGFKLAGWEGNNVHIVLGKVKLGNWNKLEDYLMTPELGAEAEGKTLVLSFDYAPWNDEDKTTTDRPILTIYKVEGDTETEIIKYTEEFDTSTLPCALKTFAVEIPNATANTRIKFWPDNHAEAGNGSQGEEYTRGHRLFIDNIMIKAK